MANTTTVNLPFITILFDDVPTSWDVPTDLASYSHLVARGLRVVNMQMIPSASGDTLVVRHAGSGNHTAAENTASAKALQLIALSPYDMPPYPGYNEGQYWFPAIIGSERSAGVQLIIEVKQ